MVKWWREVPCGITGPILGRCQFPHRRFGFGFGFGLCYIEYFYQKCVFSATYEARDGNAQGQTACAIAVSIPKTFFILWSM